jgi:glycosyltransferase involved in cell wall biosynthesis
LARRPKGATERFSPLPLLTGTIGPGSPMSSELSRLRESVPSERQVRRLFCSYHCYSDPSSGPALCTRELLELLARRGWACPVFCGPHLDFEEKPSLAQFLGAQQIGFELRQTAAGLVPLSVLHFLQGGVPVMICGSPVARSFQAPTHGEGVCFLALFERVLERFRPDLVLTYGGHWLAQEVMAHAKRRGIPVIFALHNFEYHGAELFRPIDAVLVPSRFAQAHYRRTLGLTCTAIPGPWDWTWVRCREVQGRYVTFVNPQPQKGVFVFARIAAELARRRPDIPLLVVEGRGKASWLQRTGLDLRALSNVYVMANTPDPRDFYQVSRLVLMPSLWRESFPRVPVEALINGIPVLASTRGWLPETLAQAGGFLFDVPERYTPESRSVPTAEETAPWVDTIIRLWDDHAFYEQERRRCLAAAEAWRPERLLPRFEEFFTQALSSSGGLRSPLAHG